MTEAENYTKGALVKSDCPALTIKNTCRCEPCIHCGYGPHMAIHGPLKGFGKGTKPYGHQYARLEQETEIT